MAKVNELKSKLKPGRVYRRGELAEMSASVDRHVGQLVKEGALQKLSQGLFYYPEETVFGAVPPEEQRLVTAFLKDDDFLLLSPNLFNGLGVGTTQLYNTRVVYNHKRHGKLRLGNQEFDFRSKHHFPPKLSTEFLLVDLVNNLDELAEDRTAVLSKVAERVEEVDRKKLGQSVKRYGTVGTKKFFAPLL